jgi:hypothetical protein
MDTFIDENCRITEGIWFRPRRRGMQREVQRFQPTANDLEADTYESRGFVRPARRQIVDRPHPKPLAPSILGVCKQMYQEGGSMLYSQRLVFVNHNALVSFLGPLSIETLGLLRHIEIRSWAQASQCNGLGFATAILLAKGAINLRKLHINCLMQWNVWPSSLGDALEISIPEKIADHVYSLLCPWLEAVDRTRGQNACVDVLDLWVKNFERIPKNQCQRWQIGHVPWSTSSMYLSIRQILLYEEFKNRMHANLLLGGNRRH